MLKKYIIWFLFIPSLYSGDPICIDGLFNDWDDVPEADPAGLEIGLRQCLAADHACRDGHQGRPRAGDRSDPSGGSEGV